jgi:hypothetical protein
VQHAIENKHYTFGAACTKNTKEGWGATHNKRKKRLCAWSFGHKNTKGGGGCNMQPTKKMLHTWNSGHKKHTIHHQCPTHAYEKKLKLKYFLKNLRF